MSPEKIVAAYTVLTLALILLGAVEARRAKSLCSGRKDGGEE